MEDNNEKKNGGVTLSQKAEDLRSSGYTLLVVGAIGALAEILWIAGIIPITMQGIMKYISMGVMGFLFAIFIISGINALKKSKETAQDALRENEKREEIIKWFTGEFDKDRIDSDLDLSEDENDLYFERSDFIREKITERFLELDDALLSDIIERLYTEFYGK